MIDGNYETGLLWKTDEAVLPDSFAMATRRLELLKKKMNNDAEYAASYNKAMNDFLAKNYAKKLTPSEAERITKKTRYLPHFSVSNPNKPGKF